VILLLDNYDSFTYNLAQYLGELGAELEVRRNNQITLDEVAAMKPERIVIFTRTMHTAGCRHFHRVDPRFAAKIPILGVCLGHQAIGCAVWRGVVRAPKVVHGKTSEVFHDNKTIVSWPGEAVTATRYHSLIVERSRCPRELEISAETSDHIIMGFAPSQTACRSVQFHRIGAHESGKQLLTFPRAEVAGRVVPRDAAAPLPLQIARIAP